MSGGGSESAERRREKENVFVWNSMAAAKKIESPSTPGRPIFSFSTESRKNNVPSKWDDAEKWVFSRVSKGSNLRRENVYKEKQAIQVFSNKSRVFMDPQINSSDSALDVPLQDKFTDETGQSNPNSRYSEPMKDACKVVIQQHQEVKLKHKDIGTDEMTPLGSSTTSRCPTPFMSTSPARHNTPDGRSGPVAQSVPICDITKQLKECYLGPNLEFGSTQMVSEASRWSSREEEEEEISKSLREFENGRRSVSDSGPRACAWELEEEKSIYCTRYQREEAKIQAWVNLQTAKAEAQSKKLEVKIQKMRSELEEKLMKRMAIVSRKSQEWRAAAQVEHNDQTKQGGHNYKHILKHPHNSNLSPQFTSCTCFP